MSLDFTFTDSRLESFCNALDKLSESLVELRKISHSFIPDVLRYNGLNSALNHFCESMSKVNYYFYGYENRFDIDKESFAFYSAEELVNNALKHSGASKINVQLVQEQNRISITVYDDGCGFDPKSIDKGKSGGLNNIESRLISFNGRIDILSELGKGTEISVEFKY